MENIGRLSHYELIYTPSNRLLRWRQILATVPIPTVYKSVEKVKNGGDFLEEFLAKRKTLLNI